MNKTGYGTLFKYVLISKNNEKEQDGVQRLCRSLEFLLIKGQPKCTSRIIFLIEWIQEQWDYLLQAELTKSFLKPQTNKVLENT